VCRALWQASGKLSEESRVPSKSSPGAEVTEEQLVASEEEGAASIVEIYAAVLLGFIIEGHPDLRQVWMSLNMLLSCNRKADAG
jgi:hypothetical protein